MSADPIDLLFEIGVGAWTTPLRGKQPVLDAWPTQPEVDIDTVRMWVGHSYNLGVRTGPLSGLFVIDDDQKKNGASGYVMPPTELAVETPTGGRHGYYRYPVGLTLKNSASRLAPYVDTRGIHGQVVCPPSIHPNTNTAYRWIATGQPGTLPPETIAALTGPKIDMTAPPPPSQNYAATALHREIARVRNVTEGTRNDTLNTSAFNLAQLVAGGALPHDTVHGELMSAAAMCGLDAREASKTIESGMKAGAETPRSVPDRQHTATRTVQPAPVRTPTDVLVPGSHIVKGGEFIEQGNHAFAAQVLGAIDATTIYRRASAVGELHDGQFIAITSDRMRSIVDSSVRLVAGKAGKTEDDEPTLSYRPCTRDHASVVLEFASVRGTIRELKHIATHPVCLAPDFIPARPGWNADAGVFLDVLSVPDPLPLDSCRAVLEDLICDFPFATFADRANYIGLLLTVILRPAILEPVPMHLIGSPVERTGKTKLAEIVLGCGVLGRPTPAMQIGVREEEREKRITASLLAGDAVIHLDNLHDFVDSPALASLLTSSVFRGRELGHTRLLSLINGVTIVGTGNNIHATGEISKRVVPIMLQPASDAPEMRQDYRHPLLRSYVESQRQRVLAALLGLVAAWRAAGRPLGSVGFGGFERWSSVVGGIMHVAGYPEWCSNLSLWRGSSDDFGSDLKAFVQVWGAAFETNWIAVSELFDLAIGNGLFPRQLNQATERGQRTAFGQRVMSPASDRVVGVWKIEIAGQGNSRRARLTSPVKD